MISGSPILAPPYPGEQLLEAAFVWKAARAKLFKCLKHQWVILYQHLQRFERPYTEKDWTRVRSNFAYELWRFSSDYIFGLVDSHRHTEVQRQWNHLDYVHKSYFLSQVHKAVCKIRGMLTSTVLSVQGKSFERKFLAQHKVMFLIISPADSDAFWPKLSFTIQFCMVYLKSHNKVPITSARILT